MVVAVVLPTLPKAVEYAIKILICLALSHRRPIPASAVAKCIRIPPSQAAKTLHLLSRAGLTRSRRGSNGGYWLRQSPEEIRVEQLMKLFQPVIDEDSDSSADPLLRIWSETSARYEKDWEQLTVAELARRTASQWTCSPRSEDAANRPQPQDG